MLKTQTILAATLLTAGFLCLTNVAKIAAQTSGQELEFPYQALVLSDRASVHSGPGQVHYETEELKQGEAVEVYRHDPGEWCAIRPLAGSFSLVPESTLKIISRGVGEIKADGTQAWVGTKLGPVDKPLWQVKLKKGEKSKLSVKSAGPTRKGIRRFGIKSLRRPESFVGSKCRTYSFPFRRVWQSSHPPKPNRQSI